MKSVTTYCGLYTEAEQSRRVVFGVAEQLLAKLRAIGGVVEHVRFRGVAALHDPEAVKRCLDVVAKRSGVTVFFHSTITDATRDGDQVVSAAVHDHNGTATVTASTWVDGSGECDLAAFAGASTRYGTDGAVEAGTLGMRFGGVPAALPLSHDDLIQAVRAAKLKGDSLLDKEDSLLARLRLSGDIGIFIVDADYNALQARSISDAEQDAREKAWAYLAACQTMSGWENAYLSVTGPILGLASRDASTPSTSSPRRTSRPAGASMTSSRAGRGRWSTTKLPERRARGYRSKTKRPTTSRCAR